MSATACPDCGKRRATGAHRAHEGGCECAECVSVCGATAWCYGLAKRCTADPACVRGEHERGMHWYGQEETLVETLRKRIEVLEGALEKVRNTLARIKTYASDRALVASCFAQVNAALAKTGGG